MTAKESLNEAFEETYGTDFNQFIAEEFNEAIISGMVKYAKDKCDEQRQLCVQEYVERGEEYNSANDLIIKNAHKPIFD